jgi:hypothetical protein
MVLSDLSAEGSLGEPDPPFSDTQAIVRFAERRDLTVPINLAGGSTVSRIVPFPAPIAALVEEIDEEGFSCANPLLQ